MAAPIGTSTIYGVPGDVPAEARLVVTEGANQARRYLEYGVEQRFLSNEKAANGGVAPPVEIDSASLVTSGFLGTSTTRSGSVNANVVRGTLTTAPATLCSTGNLAHIGSWRLRARVFASSANVYVRLTWRDGAGTYRSNDWAQPPLAGVWGDVDLGTITVTQALSGSQQWLGRIDAYGAAGDTLDVDYVLMFPTASYGKASAPQTFETLTTFAARDELTSGAGAVGGRVAPVGGSWVGAGTSATDISVNIGQGAAIRSANADTGNVPAGGRVDSVGSNIAGQLTQANLKFSATPNTSTYMGVVGRYTNISNFACALLDIAASTLTVRKVVAGTPTTLGSYVLSPAPSVSTFYTMRLLLDPAGRYFLWFWQTGSLPLQPLIVGSDSALATGGALATGTQGITDYSAASASITRSYTNLVAGPAADEEVIYAGRQAEIRSDGAIRQDSTGASTGPMPTYRGAHLFVPPAGTANRAARIVVRAVRNDLEETPYDNATDRTIVQTLITPRFLLPR